MGHGGVSRHHSGMNILFLHFCLFQDRINQLVDGIQNSLVQLPQPLFLLRGMNHTGNNVVSVAGLFIVGAFFRQGYPCLQIQQVDHHRGGADIYRQAIALSLRMTGLNLDDFSAPVKRVMVTVTLKVALPQGLRQVS
jgi:hypothetical protein